MSDKNTNKSTHNKFGEDIQLITLWLQSGIDWSSIDKEENQADINQPIAEDESNSITSKIVLFGVLASLVLIIAVTCKQASEISQSVQKIGVNSFKELTLEN